MLRAFSSNRLHDDVARLAIQDVDGHVHDHNKGGGGGSLDSDDDSATSEVVNRGNGGGRH